MAKEVVATGKDTRKRKSAYETAKKTGFEKREMTEWSEEFGKEADKQAREDEAQEVVAEGKVQRKRQDAYKKAEAVANKKREERESKARKKE